MEIHRTFLYDILLLYFYFNICSFAHSFSNILVAYLSAFAGFLRNFPINHFTSDLTPSSTTE